MNGSSGGAHIFGERDDSPLLQPGTYPRIVTQETLAECAVQPADYTMGYEGLIVIVPVSRDGLARAIQIPCSLAILRAQLTAISSPASADVSDPRDDQLETPIPDDLAGEVAPHPDALDAADDRPGFAGGD